MTVTAIIIDVIWLLAVVPAVITQVIAVRRAYDDRHNIGLRLGKGISILLAGAIRRERTRLVFHALMLIIGILALFARSDEDIHHTARLIILNSIVTVAIIAGQYLQVYNSVMDVRDRRRALERGLRRTPPRRFAWLWKWLGF